MEWWQELARDLALLIAGALISIGAAWLAVRRDHAYQDRTRWHADRRQMYARVLKEARSLRAALETWQGSWMADVLYPVPSIEPMHDAIEEALLVASEQGDAVGALRGLDETFTLLINTAFRAVEAAQNRAGAQAIPEDWQIFRQEAEDAISHFRRAARIELDIEPDQELTGG